MCDETIATWFAALPTVEPLQDPRVMSRAREFFEQSGVMGNALEMLVRLAIVIVQPLMLVAAAWAIDPRLLWAVAAATPVMVIARYVPRWRAAAEQQSAVPSSVLDIYSDIFASPTGAMDIRLGRSADGHYQRFMAAARNWRQPFVRGNIAALVLELVFTLLFWAACTALVVGVMIPGRLDAPVIAATVGILFAAAIAFKELPYTLTALSDVLRVLGKYRWLRNYSRRCQDQQPAAAITHTTGGGAALVLSDLGYRYPGENTWALDGINVTIPAGATVAIVGANGSGKTTLASLLLGVITPTRGTLRWGNHHRMDIRSASWQQQCSVVLQDYCRYNTTLQHNIVLGDSSPDRGDGNTQLRDALTVAGAAELPALLDNGLDTRIGDQAPYHGLSGGWWQRVATARGMYPSGRALVVLDEPTSALDAFAEKDLLRRLAQLRDNTHNRQHTLIIITHRLATARLAEIIIVLNQGKIVETGSYDQLIEAGNHFAHLVSLQRQGYGDDTPPPDDAAPAPTTPTP
ncbi:ATP-binding cassette domain-containing protein [Corynebacterium choanae]|uniref:Lipid A export ATP-binding/permease protein MsbA n=1 Tax=Corynebacterium choanae TaxID=1862358 RepID=A0A3G6JDV6_9CORY|nr:ATP-binding cassette domain-containing protein [Corynebacterium choanae]AZA14324.1 Lipid A export ATP-binding/permease protein MsbA [Corynebacterium choanae]